MRLFKLLLLLLYAVVIGVMGYATFLQQAHDASYAATHVYSTWWFFALWAVLCAMAVVAVGYRRLWRRAAVFSLHLAYLIILLGAAVTWLTAHEGQLHLRTGETRRHFTTGSGQAALPFALRLDSFSIVCYPGTNAPQDFVSHVTPTLPTASAASAATISMNHPLRLCGYRLFQSSFDPDGQGSTLTVRYDPYGTAVTYLGYALLAMSLLWLLACRAFAPGRSPGVRLPSTPQPDRRSRLNAAGLLVALSLAWAPAAQGRSIPTINRQEAERAARLQVVYNDRVCPLSTLAVDFTRKLYGRPTYKGLTAEQVVYGWLSRPDVWKDEPMIRIKDASLRRQLGIEGQYATLSQLFRNGTDYKLTTEQLTSKAARELDEKVGLILMLTGGTLVRPLPPGTPRLSERRVEAEILYNTVPFTKLLFMVSFALALVSLAGRLRRLCVVLLAVLTVAEAAVYALRWYVSGRIPLGNGFETMLFMSLAVLAVTLLVQRRWPVVLTLGTLLAGFTLLVSHLGQMNPQITPLMPVLNSPLLSLHVCTVMMAYALLALLFLSGAYGLAMAALGRRSAARQRAAKAVAMYQLGRQLLLPAVALLSVGIFLGAVWANVSWGKYWSWDPKEVWALITLMVYALPLHSASLGAFRRPAVFQSYMVAAFLTVLMTYFGVNYFLGGMHSYA